MRIFEFLLVVLFVGLLYSQFEQHLPAARTDVATFLQSEPMQELVTEKIATQVVVTREAGGPILGPDSFLAYGVVEMFIGFDLARLKVNKTGDMFVIDLPQPEIFSATLDESTVRIVRKATVLQRLSDLDAPGLNSTIRIDLLNAAKDFVDERHLMPSRDDVIVRLRKTLEAAGIPTDQIIFSVASS